MPARHSNLREENSLSFLLTESLSSTWSTCHSGRNTSDRMSFPEKRSACMDKSDADSNACKFFSKARTISVLSPFSYNQEFGE